jgi:hypothetical protein
MTYFVSTAYQVTDSAQWRLVLGAFLGISTEQNSWTQAGGSDRRPERLHNEELHDLYSSPDISHDNNIKEETTSSGKN